MFRLHRRQVIEADLAAPRPAPVGAATAKRRAGMAVAGLPTRHRGGVCRGVGDPASERSVRSASASGRPATSGTGAPANNGSGYSVVGDEQRALLVENDLARHRQAGAETGVRRNDLAGRHGAGGDAPVAGGGVVTGIRNQVGEIGDPSPARLSRTGRGSCGHRHRRRKRWWPVATSAPAWAAYFKSDGQRQFDDAGWPAAFGRRQDGWGRTDGVFVNQMPAAQHGAAVGQSGRPGQETDAFDPGGQGVSHGATRGSGCSCCRRSRRNWSGMRMVRVCLAAGNRQEWPGQAAACQGCRAGSHRSAPARR